VAHSFCSLSACWLIVSTVAFLRYIVCGVPDGSGP
jgi:hypothetical protein